MKALLAVESHGARWLVEFGRRSEISRDEWYRLIAEEGLKAIYVNQLIADLIPIVHPATIRYERLVGDGSTPAATAERIRFVKEGCIEHAQREARKLELRVAETHFIEEYLKDTHQTLIRFTALAR